MRPLILLLALTACSRHAPEVENAAPEEARAVDATPETEEEVMAEEDPSNETTLGAQRFAGDLYRRLAEDAGEGDLFFSPTSVSIALAMTWAGAEGETRRALAEALHFGDPEAVHETLGAQLRSWNLDDTPYTLRVANRLWLQDGLTLAPSFAATVERAYDAPVDQVDFAAAESTRKRINGWVADQTADRIRELIPHGVLDADTALVLTNAVYFLGTWQHAFDPEETEPAPFTTLAGEEVEVPLMHRTGSAIYGEGEGYQAISLPYDGERLSFVAVLPEAGSALGDLEADLGPALLSALVADLRPHRAVEIHLPSFRIEQGASLAGPLSDLGMEVAFGPRADFSGLIEGDRPLFIDDVFHEAFIEVDEAGTEAAAATAVIVAVRSRPVPEPEPPVFRADRPFLFFVWDHETETALFLGRVADPR